MSQLLKIEAQQSAAPSMAPAFSTGHFAEPRRTPTVFHDHDLRQTVSGELASERHGSLAAPTPVTLHWGSDRALSHQTRGHEMHPAQAVAINGYNAIGDRSGQGNFQPPYDVPQDAGTMPAAGRELYR